MFERLFIILFEQLKASGLAVYGLIFRRTDGTSSGNLADGIMSDGSLQVKEQGTVKDMADLLIQGLNGDGSLNTVQPRYCIAGVGVPADTVIPLVGTAAPAVGNLHATDAGSLAVATRLKGSAGNYVSEVVGYRISSMYNSVKATKTIGTGNSAITLTVDAYGEDGNLWTIEVRDGIGTEQPLTVDLVDLLHLLVTPATNADGDNVSTANQVANAINTLGVGITAVAGGDGTGVVAVVAQDNFAGGVSVSLNVEMDGNVIAVNLDTDTAENTVAAVAALINSTLPAFHATYDAGDAAKLVEHCAELHQFVGGSDGSEVMIELIPGAWNDFQFILEGAPPEARCLVKVSDTLYDTYATPVDCGFQRWHSSELSLLVPNTGTQYAYIGLYTYSSESGWAICAGTPGDTILRTLRLPEVN